MRNFRLKKTLIKIGNPENILKQFIICHLINDITDQTTKPTEEMATQIGEAQKPKSNALATIDKVIQANQKISETYSTNASAVCNNKKPYSGIVFWDRGV